MTSANAGAAAVVLDSVYDLLSRRTELKATVAGKADFRNTHPVRLPLPTRTDAGVGEIGGNASSGSAARRWSQHSLTCVKLVE
ncbi:MAG: hypothetical protein ACKO3P_03800, partial [Planctomycetaceae bacterium]